VSATGVGRGTGAGADATADALNRAFFLNHPRAAARRLEGLSPDQAAALLAAHDPGIMQPVWAALVPGAADAILAELADDLAVRMLLGMDLGPAAALLGRLYEDRRGRLLAAMDGGLAAELGEFIHYPPESAGHLMRRKFLAFDEGVTAGEALAQVRLRRPEAVGQLFLLDGEQRVRGRVAFPDAALAPPETRLADLAQPVEWVAALDPRDDAIAVLETGRMDVLPVVDVHRRLVGVVRRADLLEAFKEDVATDMQTMVGASKEERALSSALFAVRKRLPWLHINLLTAFLAAAVVGMFESTIARFTALAVLMPVVAGQSGNAGAQALAVTMRGLTLREITVREWFRVTRKEAGTGLLNGLAIAVTCGLGVLVWSRSFGLALVIGLSMVISMVMAGIAGALVPLALQRLGQDPAQSSSIILTTVTDVAGFMSFLGIATLLAGMLAPG
jgi:magnesium transporter